MDHAAWVVAPLVLVGVLAYSAVPKLGRGATLRTIIHNLELPQWVLPAALARAIPGLELALAVALLAPWVPVFAVASAATLVLMSVYWALIARGLTMTPRPACGCFGQAGDHRISGRTLVRNTLLVAAAGAALTLALSGRTVWSVLSAGSAGDWLWLALAALACAVTGLVLGVPGGPIREARGEGRDPATEPLGDEEGEEAQDYVRRPTPELVLHDPTAGRPVTLLELSHRRAQLLVLVNCYCVSTKEVMAEVERWHERLGLVDVRLVFSVPIAEKFVGPPPARTLLDHRGLAWRALDLTASPSAVLLGADGFLAGGPVSGSESVAEFVDDIEESLREASAGVEVADIPQTTEDALAAQGALSRDAAGVADTAR